MWILKKFNHPILMADVIRSTNGLDVGEREFIAHCIESHMGEWNTSKYSQVVLPTPSDKNQYFVHLADYLASRSDVNFVFNDNVYYKDGQTPINVDSIPTN